MYVPDNHFIQLMHDITYECTNGFPNDDAPSYDARISTSFFDTYNTINV